MVFGAKNAGATFSEKNGQIPHSALVNWREIDHEPQLLIWNSMTVDLDKID